MASKPTTPVKKKSALKGMGISILSLRDQKEEEPEEEKKASTGNGNNPFTEKELKEAWDEYAANLKGEPLLKNTMSLYHPRLISDVIFEVEVNTEINKEYLTNSSLSILSFLRSKVKNDDLTMTIKIAEGNAVKKPLTSREIFDEMAKKNPSLLKLSDEFGLELN